MKKSYFVIPVIIFVFILSACASLKETQNTTDIIKKNNIMIEGDNILFEGVCSSYVTIDYQSLSEGKQISLKTDIDNNNDTECFSIERDTPNGISITGIKGNYGCNLNDFNNVSAFDEFGELLEGYSIQLTCCDLDEDDIDEVLVSAGNSLVDMETLIYHITNQKETPYKLIDRISGQEKMYFNMEDNSIYSPYGSQGLFDRYQLVNGKLLNTN